MQVTVIATKSLRDLIWQDFYIEAKSQGMNEEQARQFANDQTAQIAEQTNPQPTELPNPVITD